jgi:hypothetical protein
VNVHRFYFCTVEGEVQHGAQRIHEGYVSSLPLS